MSRTVTPGTTKGVDIIADVEMFFGVLMFIAGMLLLFSISIVGIPMGLLGGLMTVNGIFLIALGWALKDLHGWAWWGSIVINLGIVIQHVTFWTGILSIINAVASTIIIVYLNIPSVRSLFFNR